MAGLRVCVRRAPNQGNPENLGIQMQTAIGILVFYAKCVVWDTILGLGTTPALKGDVSLWAGLVMSFYFGRRTFENVARIIKR